MTRMMHIALLVLAVVFVQSLHAAPLEPAEENISGLLALNEAEPQNTMEQAALIRRPRSSTVVFRPLFATRERDAQREESRRRTQEAKREREQRKSAAARRH